MSDEPVKHIWPELDPLSHLYSEWTSVTIPQYERARLCIEFCADISDEELKSMNAINRKLKNRSALLKDQAE